MSLFDEPVRGTFLVYSTKSAPEKVSCLILGWQDDVMLVCGPAGSPQTVPIGDVQMDWRLGNDGLWYDVDDIDEAGNPKEEPEIVPGE